MQCSQSEARSHKSGESVCKVQVVGVVSGLYLGMSLPSVAAQHSGAGALGILDGQHHQQLERAVFQLA